MKYVCMDDGFYIAMCTITGVTLQCLGYCLALS